MPVRGWGTVLCQKAMEHNRQFFICPRGLFQVFKSCLSTITRAIRLVEEQEVLLDDQAILQTLGLSCMALFGYSLIGFWRQRLRPCRKSPKVCNMA